MTMKSMTGFAQERFDFIDFSINVYFKSVNHKFLDINFKGTGITPASEKLIKEIIKDKVFRGKIEINFDLFEKNQKKWNIQFNEYLLEEILDKIVHFNEKYKGSLNLSIDSFLKIPMIFHLDYIFENFSNENNENIKNSVKKVFNNFLQSRIEEGEYISKNLLKGIKKIEDNLDIIEGEVGNLEHEIYLNYKEKIKKLLNGIEIDERRIVHEAAIAAEKNCIAEEINRLRSHNKRLKELVQSKKIDQKGREADFLSQEMQRETHTIASKTNSVDIHKYVILIRREIEKIKQQVQNVE